MWVYLLLDDVCSDMSRFHGVRDITTLDCPTFFALARRLPAYQGAVLHGLELLRAEVAEVRDEELLEQMYDAPYIRTEDEEEVLEGRVLTADELERLGPPAPEIGQFAAIFEVAKCT